MSAARQVALALAAAATAIALAAPLPCQADPRDEGDFDDGTRPPPPAPEDLADELRGEPSRAVSPPAPGKIRLEWQLGAGQGPGGAAGTAGGALRIGVVRPVALDLGADAVLPFAGGSTGWEGRAVLRVQGDLFTNPWFHGGLALVDGRDRAVDLALGVAFPFNDRIAASIGARTALWLDGTAQAWYGLLALTYAP